MPSHALDQRLFERTANELTSVETASPTDGAQLIDGWLKVIAGNNSTENIEARLRELRGQLLLAQPDPDRIKDLLLTVADHTSQLTQGRNIQEQTGRKLEDVATALRLFADQL